MVMPSNGSCQAHGGVDGSSKGEERPFDECCALDSDTGATREVVVGEAVADRGVDGGPRRERGTTAVLVAVADD